MTNRNTAALYWAGTLALVAAAATVLFHHRGNQLPTGPVSIPDRWARLRELHPEVQARFLALYQRIESETGCTLVLTSGWRGELAAGEHPAYHYFGLAQDLNVVLPNGTWLKMGSSPAAWEASGVPGIVRHTPGFRFGGDFSTPQPGSLKGDPVHVDMGRAYPIAQLRALAVRLAFPASLVGFDGRRVSLALVTA